MCGKGNTGTTGNTKPGDIRVSHQSDQPAQFTESPTGTVGDFRPEKQVHELTAEPIATASPSLGRLGTSLVPEQQVYVVPTQPELIEGTGREQDIARFLITEYRDKGLPRPRNIRKLLDDTIVPWSKAQGWSREERPSPSMVTRARDFVWPRKIKPGKARQQKVLG
jgi:hypothetical protein